MVGVSQLPHPGYANDTMLDELTRQLAAENKSRRLSRGSGSQRMGNPMRITKPGSANNSPRSNILQSRRRTLIGEGQQRPHLQPVDNYLPTPTAELQYEAAFESEKRQARPLSWHPPSQQVPPQQLYRHQISLPYVFPTYNEAEHFASYQQLPPTPAVYSGYNSPASAFSPLTLPYSSMGSQQYCSPSRRPPSAQQQPQQAPAYHPDQSPIYGSSIGNNSSSSSSSELAYQPAPGLSTTAGGALDWETFAAQGFDRYAAPPTPEDFVAHHQPLQKVEAIAPTKVTPEEETIPFQPLEDDESEGEILYGMGLYDAPDREPALDFHRSTVFSLLGGSVPYPEPTGKRLKLEDAWEPPASDDEEEEGEEDADAEAEDDEDDE